MDTLEEYEDYLAELRKDVCSRCIERQPNCPPCAPHGKGCGIERHIPELVELCRTTDSVLIDPYIQELHDKICADCEFRDQPTCPCPLDYLLQLAVESVERVQQRRSAQEES